MEQKYNDLPMLEMVSLSEEINMLNFKLKQYIEQLSNDPSLLDTTKKLGNTIDGKVKDLVGRINKYKPTEMPEAETATPSYVSENQPKETVTTNGNVGTVSKNVTPPPSTNGIKGSSDDTKTKKTGKRAVGRRRIKNV